MHAIWNLSWMWTADVRDFRVFQKPLQCKEVDEDVTIIDFLPGESELGLAVRCGHQATVERLLSNSADPNARDAWGQTLLFHAVKRGNFTIIASLLLAGADPTRTSHAGLSALDVADDKHAKALLQALAPHASRLAPDTFLLADALDALPAELGTRFDEAMGSRRVMSI